MYMREGRSVVFTDESYIHSSHTQSKEWADDSTLGLKKPISKGQRLIMVHAGGREGFIPNALLIFPSGNWLHTIYNVNINYIYVCRNKIW